MRSNFHTIERHSVREPSGTFHMYETSQSSFPPVVRHISTAHERLPYVVCARTAWRCATPCCLPAHLTFCEECLDHDLHVFRRSSRNVCNSRSMAVGGARPYLGLTECFVRLIQPAESNLVADLVWQKGHQTSPVRLRHLVLFAYPLCYPSTKKKTKTDPNKPRRLDQQSVPHHR